MTTVTCLGPEGTFSHEFAREAYPNADVIPIEGELVDVLPSALKKGADFAVLPFLNSSGIHVVPAQQSVGQHIGQYWVVGASAHLVIHHLVATTHFKELHRIKTKEQVYPQCKGWLSKNGEGVEKLPAPSTSAALKELLDAPRDEQAHTAVICNQLAIDLYGGKVLERNIEDDGNRTLFWKLSKTLPAYSERILICVKCPGVDCYNASVDMFVAEGCLLKFSTLMGQFTQNVPMFLEFEVPGHLDPDTLIKKTCQASNGIRSLAGTYSEEESISRCVVGLFEPRYEEDDL